jgi:hypothetical protein
MLSALLKQVEQLGYVWMLKKSYDDHYWAFALSAVLQQEVSQNHYMYEGFGKTMSDAVEKLLVNINRQ